MPAADSSPRLLVSVRDAQEAAAALAGGCDILDVKEPTRGSLGMADLNQIADVVRTGHETSTSSGLLMVSAALGELRDWTSVELVPRLPDGLQFVKLGLAGMANHGDWGAVWQDVRQRFDIHNLGERRWVAVAYADWQAAEAPPPEEVIDAAIDARCAAVLFDTSSKDSRGLLDWLPRDELQRHVRRLHEKGLLLAVAGRLGERELPRLRGLEADIIAIRSAACHAGQRTNSISAERVRAFRASMHDCLRRHESNADRPFRWDL